MYLQTLAEPFAAIGLDELTGAVPLRDRVDRKYVVSLDCVAALTDRLWRTHRVLDIDEQRLFDYHSAYFDSPTLSTFRDHLQGRRRRFKCRTRRYGGGGLCMFEVKLKGARGHTIKHQMEYPVAEHGLLNDAAKEFLSACLVDAYGHDAPDGLGPELHMRYRRMTLAAPQLGEKLTCDFGLRFQGGEGLADQFAIVEIKSPGGAALGRRVLRELHAREVRVCSKYCLGIALTRSEVNANALRPLLRRYFTSHAASHPTPV